MEPKTTKEEPLADAISKTGGGQNAFSPEEIDLERKALKQSQHEQFTAGFWTFTIDDPGYFTTRGTTPAYIYTDGRVLVATLTVTGPSNNLNIKNEGRVPLRVGGATIGVGANETFATSSEPLTNIKIFWSHQ